MVKTLRVHAEVPPDREVRILLPADVPIGPAEITVVVVPDGRERLPKLRDLARSEFFGMWAGRRDIDDSFAVRLRETAWKRSE